MSYVWLSACMHVFVCILASAVIAEAHVLCLISFNIQLSLLRQWIILIRLQ